MLSTLKDRALDTRTYALTGLVLATMLAATLAFTQAGAFAAADPTTGIDWKTDLVDPSLAAIKPAIVAGLAVLVLFMAVSGGKKMLSKVSGAR